MGLNVIIALPMVINPTLPQCSHHSMCYRTAYKQNYKQAIIGLYWSHQGRSLSVEADVLICSITVCFLIK